MKYLKSLDSFDKHITEKRVTVKRRYTENHPAKSISTAARVRNSVIEAIQSEINVIIGNIGDTAKLFEQNQLILNTFTAEGIFNSLMSYIGMSQEQRKNIVESSIYNLNYLLDNDKSLETWISIIE